MVTLRGTTVKSTRAKLDERSTQATRTARIKAQTIEIRRHLPVDRHRQATVVFVSETAISSSVLAGR